LAWAVLMLARAGLIRLRALRRAGDEMETVRYYGIHTVGILCRAFGSAQIAFCIRGVWGCSTIVVLC